MPTAKINTYKYIRFHLLERLSGSASKDPMPFLFYLSNMKQHILSRILCLSMVLSTQISQAQYLPRVAPEEVNMSSQHLLYADEAILQAIEKKEIPGAVLAVVKDGKMAYLKAYGNRSVYPKVEAMTTHTLFDMASCSKSMSTAICTMILAEQGKIRLMDPVSLYIPNFADWQNADKKESYIIRIQDLLTHTSGLPGYAPVEELKKKFGSPCPQELLDYICQCKRSFKPQTDFQYSCLNFVILQYIIESVSGQSLREFAQTHIFKKLGMKRTDYLPCQLNKQGKWENTTLPIWANTDKDWTKDIAPTELQDNGQILCGQVHDPLARILNGGISGNAGVFSCAEDIALLCAALQNGGEWNGQRILSPLGVKTMRSIPRQVKKIGRTLGWDRFTPYASNNGDFFSTTTYSHTGYTGTSIVIDPENQTSVILLTNAVHPQDKHSMVRLRAIVANIVATSLRPTSRTYTPHYYQRFLQFMDEPPITPQNIVMIGNSLTENGGNWEKRLKQPSTVNRGIIGDETIGIYDRLHQILPGHPKAIYLMTGINDLSHNLSPDSIISMIRLVIERIQRESPSTQIFLQSLLPINESFQRYKSLENKTDLIPPINRRLQTLSKEKGITFIHLFPLFTLPNTPILRPELTTDGLHLNEKGYDIWVKELKRYKP